MKGFNFKGGSNVPGHRSNQGVTKPRATDSKLSADATAQKSHAEVVRAVDGTQKKP